MNQDVTASARRRARIAEIERKERGRRAARLVAAAALVLPLVTVLGLIAVGLGPAPRTTQAAVEAEGTTSGVRLEGRATPAESAVNELLFSPPAGWAPVGPITAAASDPVTEGCASSSPAAVLTLARRFEVGGQVVGLRVSAYGAGLGGLAVRDVLAAVDSCAGAGSRQSSTVGLDAAVVWRGPDSGRPPLGALLWRRGDVLVSLVVADRSTDGLAALAGEIDAALLRSLEGRCVETASSADDAARSPYRRDPGFTGLLEPVPVDVPAVPDPASGVPTLSPAPTISYPVRPADPVSPSELPTPVAPPVMPFDPGPQPTSTWVAARRADPVGPGCGWAFTGQVTPTFDEAAEALRVEAAVAQARSDIAALQQQWAQARGAFAAQSGGYEQQLASFLAYAEQVRRVAAAWDAVSAARADYGLRLAEYEAAVAAVEQWWRDRVAAQAAYEAAVDVCSAEDPGAVETPAATQSAGASGAPSPAPSTECPPPVPSILLEAPPPVPASPAPVG